MSDNLRHWDALSRTDPKHTKPFDRGRFKGTATKPIWNERLMTEHFGPAGIGWGMDKPEFTLIPAGDELAVFCTVALWYRDGEARGEVYGVGGDKVLRIDRSGAFISDEAYKAAYTDALGNAFKHLGVNADIHMGRFEDHKYVRELREEFAEERSEPAPATPTLADKLRKPVEAMPPAHPVEPPAEDPAKDAARQDYRRIHAALEKANTLKMVDDILKIQAVPIARIEKFNAEAAAGLRALATARKTEMLAATP